MEESTLYGPMHSKAGVASYENAIEKIKVAGGKIAFGGKVGGNVPLYSGKV